MGKRRVLKRELESWMIESFRQHVLVENQSARSWPAQHSVNQVTFAFWLKNHPDFIEINRQYIERRNARKWSFSHGLVDKLVTVNEKGDKDAGNNSRGH